MRLIITNFKGIKNLELSFGKESTLLKGPSGTGKSTVLEAIKWCLYGHVKNISPLTGDKKTIVELHLEDYLIKRSKNPENLSLVYQEKNFIDREAQALIDNKFNREDLWLLSSYIKQGENNFFLETNQQHKLELIKELIFKDEKDTTLKYYNKIDEIVSKNNQIYKESEGVINYLKNEISSLKDKNNIFLEDFLESKKNKKLIKTGPQIRKKINELYQDIEKLEKAKEINEEIEIKQKEAQELQESLSEYPPQMSLDWINKWQEFKECKTLLEEYKEEDFSEEPQDLEDLLSLRVEALKNKEIQEAFPGEDLEELYKSKKKLYNNYLEYASYHDIEIKKNKIEAYIETLKKTEEKLINSWFCVLKDLGVEKKEFNEYSCLQLIENHLKDDSVALKCPSCSAKLFLKNGILEISGVEISREKKDIYKNNLEKLISLYTNLRKAEDKLEEYKCLLAGKNKPLIRDINRDKLEEDISLLSLYIKNIPSLEKINKNIKYCKSYKKYKKILKIYNDLKKYNFFEFKEPKDFNIYYHKFHSLLLKLENIKKFLSSNKYTKIIDYDSKLATINKTKVLIDRLDKFEKAIEKWLPIEEKENQLKELLEKQKNIINDNENHQILRKCIKEAENKYMQTKLEEINVCLNTILSTLFNDIKINLTMFKHLKNGTEKPQINLSIILRGKEYPNFHYFSGGEKDRISIAITITFNLILGSPIILLDEVMSSLEAEKREECLKIFKKYIKDKYLINICHETVEGYYDKIMKIHP